MERIALVLGVTGGIGGAVARRLVERGWSVRALVRAHSAHRVPQGVSAVIGDAMDGAAVAAAARGATVIVHAVNPPGYRNWNTVVLPMLDNSIAAARVSGAQVLLPGTVYNYGPDSLPLIDETAPQHAVTRKGAIRVEMERRLRAAADAGKIRALIVRAGDFFGPGAANSWFAQGLITPGGRPRVIRNPAARGLGIYGGIFPTWPKPWSAWWSMIGCRPLPTITWVGTGTERAPRWSRPLSRRWARRRCGLRRSRGGRCAWLPRLPTCRAN
ncbi:NAD-dependent epimerase/dehydratase family protein [Novosphingobium pokkalii]|uniref:NAD-dependent epimerase/dehydratase family protein n=1 Tax=Novosphingobium pokkalii TaxID=1770194 RepID=UPI00362CBF7F